MCQCVILQWFDNSKHYRFQRKIDILSDVLLGHTRYTYLSKSTGFSFIDSLAVTIARRVELEQPDSIYPAEDDGNPTTSRHQRTSFCSTRAAPVV